MTSLNSVLRYPHGCFHHRPWPCFHYDHNTSFVLFPLCLIFGWDFACCAYLSSTGSTCPAPFLPSPQCCYPHVHWSLCLFVDIIFPASSLFWFHMHTACRHALPLPSANTFISCLLVLSYVVLFPLPSVSSIRLPLIIFIRCHNGIGCIYCKILHFCKLDFE